MQSIAEEVVSSSGGGGTYITSGFSNYVGHSAIGIGYDRNTAYLQVAIGVVAIHYGMTIGYVVIEGRSFRDTGNGTTKSYFTDENEEPIAGVGMLVF